MLLRYIEFQQYPAFSFTCFYEKIDESECVEGN